MEAFVGNYENEQDVCDVHVNVFIVSAFASSTLRFQFWYMRVLSLFLCHRFNSLIVSLRCIVSALFFTN